MRCESLSASFSFLRTLAAMLLLISAGAVSGWAATETVIYDFKDRMDGYSPVSVIMVDGKLYGTTATGGKYDNGTVFELVNTKSGWVKNALHAFTGKADGYNPGALTADTSGNLYGAAGQGPGGLIFELSRRPAGWQFKVIHAFTGSDGDGPSNLIVDEAGILYGGTGGGGGKGCPEHNGCGTLFRLSPVRGKWKLTTLHRFDGEDGNQPLPPLYRDAKGNLYGTTEIGGGRGCFGNGCGTVFEVSPVGNRWKFAVLRRFSGPDGASPTGALVMDSSGSLYGTVSSSPGAGAVFKLDPTGNRWKETLVHRFSGSPDGFGPTDGVVFDGSGNMYGTTVEGGAFYDGAIFELSPSGSGWQESVPFSFDESDGDDPVSLVPRGDGKYYGTTWIGGSGTCQGPGCGLVYEFVP
jgi:uncharacterized repeat protein (TIGR03803 family)